MKMTKKELDVCNSFVDKMTKYCKMQEDFYYKIAQNDDHSEDFVNRMTDMATAFHSISQFVYICADNIFADLQAEPLGDSNEQLGQVDQTANDIAQIKTADENNVVVTNKSSAKIESVSN